MNAGDVGIFERFAPIYDYIAPAANRETLQRGLDQANRPIERILDVGGGTGRGARAIEAKDRIVVDPAEKMGKRAQKHGLTYVRGDGARLPLADETVDAVLIVDALHHITDQKSVLAEARRVLRPGGVLVVNEFDPTTLRGRFLVVGEHLVGFESTFHAPDTLQRALEAAGFEATVLERGFGYTVAGVCE